ncbi:MAG: transketolase [Bacteroidales bacterium]|nr:transketolase [Bacteroidales bacterium]
MNNIIRNLSINTIRTLSMDAVQKANSGHPGTPMGMAPVVFSLFHDFMKFNPKNPTWFNRDRFILSAGHASMMLYSILHVTGYDLSLEDIKHFRELNSRCPGHPEYGVTPGVETTTGPLGQGLATSVGFAIAQKKAASYFNRDHFSLIDYTIYALAGDGCMMEGISSEAASLAGHLGLDNLVWIYDQNHITIEGKTNLTFTEEVGDRFEAYNWEVFHVEDANDTEAVKHMLEKAKKVKGKPALVIIKSHIGYGSPNKQDTAEVHGSPLGAEEIRETKKFYGWDPDKQFYVPEEVQNLKNIFVEKGRNEEQEWNKLKNAYTEKFPELAREFDQFLNRELPEGLFGSLHTFPTDQPVSGRKASSIVLREIAADYPFIFGGSADLSPSTHTDLPNEISFEQEAYRGRNLHFGIREHAMAAIANGLYLSGFRSYVSTFFVFSDYLRPSLRLSALMELPVIYIFTHDSIGVGEDGPTHQPVEHLASLRAMPNLEVIRPADANEVGVLWKHILSVSDHPIALVLSRQNLPVLNRSVFSSAEQALKGGYLLAESNNPKALLLATGSEVSVAVEAYEKLKQEHIPVNVISIPSWELFEQQPASYKESVLPSSVPCRLAVEAGTSFGWNKYLGNDGHSAFIGVNSFGKSGKDSDVFNAFGINADNVVQKVKELILNP